MLTRVGLQMPDGLRVAEWEKAGRQLNGIVDSSAWCLGDWLLFGKEHYPDRYKQAVRTIGLRYQTLRNYAWVANRFDRGRRRPTLSFQHHAEVASLPVDEQEHWLDRCEEGWTTRQLRIRIRESRSVPERNDAPPATPLGADAGAYMTWWREAARLSGKDLDEWVTDTLNGAAVLVIGEGADDVVDDVVDVDEVAARRHHDDPHVLASTG